MIGVSAYRRATAAAAGKVRLFPSRTFMRDIRAAGCTPHPGWCRPIQAAMQRRVQDRIEVNRAALMDRWRLAVKGHEITRINWC